MNKIERAFAISGWTALLGLVVSWIVQFRAPYHSGLRGASFGAFGASATLILVWVIAMLVLLALRRGKVHRHLHLLFIPNAIVAALLMLDL